MTPRDDRRRGIDTPLLELYVRATACLALMYDDLSSCADLPLGLTESAVWRRLARAAPGHRVLTATTVLDEVLLLTDHPDDIVQLCTAVLDLLDALDEQPTAAPMAHRLRRLLAL
jgi:hypothetical protein